MGRSDANSSRHWSGAFHCRMTKLRCAELGERGEAFILQSQEPCLKSQTAIRRSTGVLFGVAALALAGCGQAATLRATPANLGEQLGKLKDGQTLELEAGVYQMLWIADRTFATPATVTGKGAVLQGLMVRNSAGLAFMGLELVGDCPTPKDPFVAQGSRNLRFAGLKVSGGGACRNGLLIRESSDIAVTGSEFTKTSVGITHLNTPRLTIADNHFHHLAIDGIAGGCSSNLTITGNRIHDFRPTPGAHGDGIQLWMRNCKADTYDTLIADNLIYRGEGGVETVAQGIFVTGGPLRFHRIAIRDNVVLGGMYNGITLAGGGEGATIENNTVLGFPDMQNWIRSADNLDLRITGNRTQKFEFPKGREGVTEKRNDMQGPARDRGAALLEARERRPRRE